MQTSTIQLFLQHKHGTLPLSASQSHGLLTHQLHHVMPVFAVQAPRASGVRLLQHPLEEAGAVVADVSVRAGVAGSYAGWSGEEVVWSSTDLPLVATYSKVRAKSTSRMSTSRQEHACHKLPWMKMARHSLNPADSHRVMCGA